MAVLVETEKSCGDEQHGGETKNVAEFGSLSEDLFAHVAVFVGPSSFMSLGSVSDFSHQALASYAEQIWSFFGDSFLNATRLVDYARAKWTLRRSDRRTLESDHEKAQTQARRMGACFSRNLAFVPSLILEFQEDDLQDFHSGFVCGKFSLIRLCLSSLSAVSRLQLILPSRLLHFHKFTSLPDTDSSSSSSSSRCDCAASSPQFPPDFERKLSETPRLTSDTTQAAELTAVTAPAWTPSNGLSSLLHEVLARNGVSVSEFTVFFVTFEDSTRGVCWEEKEEEQGRARGTGGDGRGGERQETGWTPLSSSWDLSFLGLSNENFLGLSSEGLPCTPIEGGGKTNCRDREGGPRDEMEEIGEEGSEQKKRREPQSSRGGTFEVQLPNLRVFRVRGVRGLTLRDCNFCRLETLEISGETMRVSGGGVGGEGGRRGGFEGVGIGESAASRWTEGTAGSVVACSVCFSESALRALNLQSSPLLPNRKASVFRLMKSLKHVRFGVDLATLKFFFAEVPEDTGLRSLCLPAYGVLQCDRSLESLNWALTRVSHKFGEVEELGVSTLFLRLYPASMGGSLRALLSGGLLPSLKRVVVEAPPDTTKEEGGRRESRDTQATRGGPQAASTGSFRRQRGETAAESSPTHSASARASGGIRPLSLSLFKGADRSRGRNGDSTKKDSERCQEEKNVPPSRPADPITVEPPAAATNKLRRLGFVFRQPPSSRQQRRPRAHPHPGKGVGADAKAANGDASSSSSFRTALSPLPSIPPLASLDIIREARARGIAREPDEVEEHNSNQLATTFAPLPEEDGCDHEVGTYEGGGGILSSRWGVPSFLFVRSLPIGTVMELQLGN